MSGGIAAYSSRVAGSSWILLKPPLRDAPFGAARSSLVWEDKSVAFAINTMSDGMRARTAMGLDTAFIFRGFYGLTGGDTKIMRERAIVTARNGWMRCRIDPRLL
jgi:hypothetical protein